MTELLNDCTINITTGCPPNHVPLFYCQFLGALKALEALRGHFSTAHSVEISKISLILSFDQCLTNLLQIYCESPKNEDPQFETVFA